MPKDFSMKAHWLFTQGNVIVLNTDIEAFRQYLIDAYGVSGLVETVNDFGLVHVQYK